MSAEEILYSTLAGAGAITAIVIASIPTSCPSPALPAIAFVTPEAEYLVTIHDNPAGRRHAAHRSGAWPARARWPTSSRRPCCR